MVTMPCTGHPKIEWSFISRQVSGEELIEVNLWKRHTSKIHCLCSTSKGNTKQDIVFG